MLLPSTLAALGLVDDDEAQPEAFRGEGVLPIATAAIQAVNTPGTELGGTEVGGSRRGVRGLWVELRHRRRHPDTEVEAPDERRRAGDGREVAAAESDPPSRRSLPPDGAESAQSPGKHCADSALSTLLRGQSELKIARMRSRLV